ncbi:hypothetical protein [Burkholderia vietnamiensis]|uniref:hypothetical protein n=1 Tax=Burkholderia vietnamiensis TaxID=60552 RepID=UPI001BA09BE5|nr:hypothetical protein [Burkholderia vietnamiensis]MBR7910013.1 hypothetical protein [Burkholderia vietnamiensis]MDN8038532.1 hypothetical protein [Burkholderia vietnamiensis]HDR9274247.1 hypothetical protein [Burkholderia vietnamiensis]
MEKRMKQTPEAAAAEQEQIAKLRDEIKALCNRVPPPVLQGSYQTAVAWKKAASDAYRLASSKSPTLQKLNDAKTAMQIAAQA